GSFLAGVFVDDASDFERWSERERGRRREAYCRALENCARAAESRQAPAEAVHWWRRLQEENPLSTRTTVSLAQALEAAGERDDALRIAETFATRGGGTERDLAPQLAELLTRLRGGSRSVVPPSASGSGAAGDVLAVELADALGAAYRIEGRISRSRMYQVFRARHAQSGRVSVIKVLEPSIVRYGDRRTLVDHLQRATALVHEHIAGFDTVGTTAHLVYLVGPDDEGETLRDRVKQRGELSVNEGLTVARQVGNALAYAHAAGVLHLDVTPKRILLTARKAALRDTGLASALRAATAAGGQSIDETGVLLGTAAFMSPELVRGEGTPNERTDLFSLAAAIFHALTGVLPFGVAGIGAQPRPTAPSAAAIRSTVPRNVDAALSRALSPLRGDRQASVRELLNELEPS
ncbi:MAG: protein kinase domain-containing protein, partial [Gemmatimonadaceae bacterium]